jgi:hypothetical protein
MTTARLCSGPKAPALMLPMPVTMPSAGVLRIRSSALRRWPARPRPAAVFAEEAWVAQVGDVFARGAQAQGVAFGHGVGAAGVQRGGVAINHPLQVGARATAALGSTFAGIWGVFGL